ncbi:MAG: DoxX family membrane protein [Leptospiraceae bacterium]|nr:DoxX family membrane protein [Leptospiraceae bacterium]MCK6381357.1 DoxX family membrane protein [Leptospiraceae bacterium]NUM41517.1 DoxX family membrane protein [Leptospiraceae bacterium]
MRKIVLAARILLGLIFVVFGFNGFFNFIPSPPPAPEAGAFFGALFATKYLIPVLKTTEIVCGILLLSNYFVPLALTILAPIAINIFLFHVFLNNAGMPVAIAVVALEIFLAYSYRKNYSGVLTAKAEPTE